MSLYEQDIDPEDLPDSGEITQLFFVFDNLIEGEELGGMMALGLFQRIQLESLQ